VHSVCCVVCVVKCSGWCVVLGEYSVLLGVCSGHSVWSGVCVV